MSAYSFQVTQKRYSIRVGRGEDVPAIKAGRPITEMPVERFFRIITIAAGICKHLRPGVTGRQGQVSLSLRSVELQGMIIRSGIAQAHTNLRKPLERAQGVCGKPLCGGKQRVCRLRLE